MSLNRMQNLDTISRTNLTFYEIDEGRSEDEEDEEDDEDEGDEEENVFDTAFRASNSQVEREIKQNTNFSLTIVEEANVETSDEFPQFSNIDMQPSGPYQPLPLVFDASTPNMTSPSNDYDAISRLLLLSNTTSDPGSSSQEATPCLYTGKWKRTQGSEYTPEGHDQHRQRDSSEGIRLLYPALIKTEFSPFSSFPQIPAIAELLSLSSPSDLVSKSALVWVAPKETSASRNIRKSDLDSGRTEGPPHKRQRSKKVDAPSSKEEVAKREKFLGKNRQAARKCRRNNKTWITHLLERAEFFEANNAEQSSKIELVKVELQEAKEVAVEHCRVCPILSL